MEVQPQGGGWTPSLLGPWGGSSCLSRGRLVSLGPVCASAVTPPPLVSLCPVSPRPSFEDTRRHLGPTPPIQKGQGFGPSSRVTSRRRNAGGGGFPPSAPRAGLAHRVTVLGAVPSLTPQKNTASAQSGHTKLLNARPAGRLRGRRASPGSHFCVTFLPWSSQPTFPAPFGVMCHSPANVGDPFVW